MRITFIVCLLLVSMGLFAQGKIIGRYRDYFGSRIELNSDSTFKYTWHFDMQSSWTIGTWTLVKEIVVFHMTPVFDTLRNTTNNNIVSDSLILSPDQKSNRIASIDNSVLLSYGQNYQLCPDKLFYRNEKLYKIRNGHLVKKKQRGFWTGKKWIPWYFKSMD